MPFHLPWSLYLYDLDFSYLFNAEEQLWKKSTLHLKTVDLVLIPITYVRYFNTSFKHDSNMTPRLSAHFSIFSLIFLEINFLLGIATQWICKKIAMISLNHRVKLELKKKRLLYMITNFSGRTERWIDTKKTNFSMSQVHVPQRLGCYSALVLCHLVDLMND